MPFHTCWQQGCTVHPVIQDSIHSKAVLCHNRFCDRFQGAVSMRHIQTTIPKEINYEKALFPLFHPAYSTKVLWM